MKTLWTVDQVQAFRCWHDSRLIELGYPQSLVMELTRSREDWLVRSVSIQQASNFVAAETIAVRAPDIDMGGHCERVDGPCTCVGRFNPQGCENWSSR